MDKEARKKEIQREINSLNKRIQVLVREWGRIDLGLPPIDHHHDPDFIPEFLRRKDERVPRTAKAGVIRLDVLRSRLRGDRETQERNRRKDSGATG
jgi:hypothetical protein